MRGLRHGVGRAVERKSPSTSSVPDLGQAAVSLGAFGEPARTAGGRASFLRFFAEPLVRLALVSDGLAHLQA